MVRYFLYKNISGHTYICTYGKFPKSMPHSYEFVSFDYFRVKNYFIFYFLRPFFPLLYYLIEITYDSIKLIKTPSIKQYPLIAKGKTKFI